MTGSSFEGAQYAPEKKEDSDRADILREIFEKMPEIKGTSTELVLKSLRTLTSRMVGKAFKDLEKGVRNPESPEEDLIDENPWAELDGLIEEGRQELDWSPHKQRVFLGRVERAVEGMNKKYFLLTQ